MSVADHYAAFSFTPNGQATLLLAGSLESLDDDLGSRLASFEYLMRDGGELQPLGAAQAKFSFRIVLVGRDVLTPGGPPLSAGERYAQLVRMQRLQPRGLLTHPRLGRYQAGWTRIRAHEQPARAVDTVECTVEFVEDQLDQAVASEQRTTPQGQADQAVSAYSILVAGTALRFGSSQSPVMRAAHRASQAFAQAAGAFVDAALLALQDSAPAPELEQQLGAVEAAQTAALAALTATLPQTLEPDVALTPYRHQAYQTYAACVELLRVVEEQQPALEAFTVPAAASLDQVLIALYGPAARGYQSPILRYNPGLSPLWIPAGTRIRIIARPPQS